MYTGLSATYYLNNIGNIGIYFSKYINFIGIFIKNIHAHKVLKLCIEYKNIYIVNAKTCLKHYLTLERP